MVRTQCTRCSIPQFPPQRMELGRGALLGEGQGSIFALVPAPLTNGAQTAGPAEHRHTAKASTAPKTSNNDGPTSDVPISQFLDPFISHLTPRK